MRRAPRLPSPAAVLSVAALFFALGGSALALGDAVLGSAAASKPQPRCQAGAVRGIAVVTGNPPEGIENLPDRFTSAASVFGYRFNCTGGRIEVRRAPGQPGVYDVRFVGIRSAVAIANPLGEAGAAAVGQSPDGSFRVFVTGPVHPSRGYYGPREDIPFVIVAL